MKADFHCHTKATKHGEKGRTVSPDVFAQRIEQAGVQVVAITNHNHFDYEQYLELSESVNGKALVWPGVELDVTGKDGQRWHTLAICSPKEVQSFDAAVRELVGDASANDFQCAFSEAWQRLYGLNALFVSHCHQKNPAISENNIASIMADAGEESWRLFFEPRSLITLGIWSNHGRSMLIGSDVKNWDLYVECTFSNLCLHIDSFEQFCLLARRDSQVIETLLGRKEKSVLPAKPHSSVTLSLPIFNDVNIVFGQKGTGKTEIVKSLCAEYDKLGIKHSSYIGGRKYDEYEKLLSITDEIRDSKDFGREDGIDDINIVLNWAENPPTPLREYVRWHATRGNSEKKDGFKLSESQKLPERPNDEYRRHKSNKSIVESFSNNYIEKNLSGYLSNEHANELSLLLQALSQEIESKARAEYFAINSIAMTNTALDAIKSIIDRKSDTKSKPSTASFTDFVEGRIRLWKASSRILGAISESEKVRRSYLGTLEDKGELFTVVKRRYLTSGSKTEEFDIGINKLKKWKRDLEAIRASVLSFDLPAKVAAFVETHQDSGVTDLSDFIGLTKYVVIGGSEDPYVPSDGEKGILVIEKKLREEATVYLLDEPELGMSNLYIDSVVRPILQNRAAEGKTIIVSTHNANLAVRTLPYCSIYREHVKGDTYRTYIGNPYSNELVDINDSSNKLNWAEISMATLEGGPDAFRDRQTIYEAGESCK